MVKGVWEPKVEYAAINGKLCVDDAITRAKILYAMRLFRDAVKLAHHLIREGYEWNDISRRLTRYISNAHYGHSAHQRGKLWREQPYLKLKKKFLFSVGKSQEKGNRNMRFVEKDGRLWLKVKIPHADGKHEWVEAPVKFGKRYLPIIRHMMNGEKIRYGVEISENFKVHVYVPFWLYKQYLGRENNGGNYMASFDLNSDRINMVIVNQNGEILDVKNEHFHEVSMHGYPRNRAKNLRLQALAKLLDYARHHGVGIVLFENLPLIKSRRCNSSRKGNRKISRFAKRELIDYGVSMALKRGFRVYLVNPAYTTRKAKEMHNQLGLDVHTVSAYILALRYLSLWRSINDD